MSTTQAPRSTSTLLSRAAGCVTRLFSRKAAAADTSDVWELFRMTRGADSLRPAVIRKLAAHAAHSAR